MPTAEDRARELIEAELRDLTCCHQCGRSMRVSVRGAEMWVECDSLGSKSGLRLGISAGFHDRHLVELPEGVLAAA
jgi:ribosomal protein L37AE/L43A